MIERLARRPMSVTELGEPFPISAPAISKHLRALERAGLIKREIRGRTHLCRLEPSAIDEALGWLEQQRSFWEQSLDRLEGHFTRTRRKEKNHGTRRARKR